MTRLVPLLHTDAIIPATDFYVRILGCRLLGIWPEAADPGFAVLTLDGQEITLSSHGGDSVSGQHLLVIVPDVDAAYAQIMARGHTRPNRPESPLHQGPIDQTWGTREFAVDDPDGNTLVFCTRG
jgi:Uncharacterized protein conserved in bacteria